MLLETLAQDVHYALRTLRRSPAFAATAVLTLGAGLGLNTMLFTLFDAYVLRPVAVNQPYSLYQLSFATRVNGSARFDWEQYQQIREQTPAFSDALAASSFGTRVGTRSLDGVLVSGNYFSMLGVKMALGRPLLPDDRSTAVLSYRLWQSMFDSNPAAIGRKLLVNGNPLEIVGVCGSEFDGMPPGDTPPDFYVPVSIQNAVAPGADRYAIVGRLRPGIAAAQARASLSILARNLTAQLPEAEHAIGAVLVSRATPVVLDAKALAVFSPLMVVFGLVLAICCANVTSMMLARALARQREIGVRLSLGAARGRLIRQLLSENLLLASLAGLTGFAVSTLGLGAVQRLLVSTMPKSYAGLVVLAPLTADRRVLFFLLLSAAVVTVVSGLAPAMQATSINLMGALRGEFSARFRSTRLRGALVASQVAVCLLLLVLTGVLLRNSAALRRLEVGYDTRGMVSPLIFSSTANADAAKLARHLEAQPWVASVAVALRAPLSGRVRSVPLVPSGRTHAEASGYNNVSSEYFDVLHIPILRGRNFLPGETSAAIVSQATARRFWPGQNALGQTLDAPEFHTRSVVIGVAQDVVSGMLFDGLDRSMVYFPTALGSAQARTLIVRAKTDSARARELLEQSLTDVLPDRGSLAVAAEDSFVLQVYPFRAAMVISLVLGGVALLLTISGMYGVMAYVVGQRSREIGIRMALGASPGSVIRLVLAQSGRLAAIGLVCGLAGSLALARLLSVAFFMLRTFDLPAYTAGLTVVTLAALAAAWIPSRRAAHINPMDTLRAE
ncbi:MAG: ADOP family duplicated permease [Candidatus Sulfopaludibacter sp.]|nr:ADOP family duplicated permease [Candidatus Sulfopaludibacter sp.]